MHKETMHKEITDKQLSGKACTVKHHLIWINNSGGGKATTRLAVPPLRRKAHGWTRNKTNTPAT
ncbi:hypothetical protein ACRRRU_04120 [Dickeya fangzhongdai]|uniref:hypothetical protein n=1 Tax=Dickeya fangzhongdai TaxID=1778540 RepID=UPI0013C454BF|nr:hypothetical protein [Dickeya fangzhongdai]